MSVKGPVGGNRGNRPVGDRAARAPRPVVEPVVDAESIPAVDSSPAPGSVSARAGQWVVADHDGGVSRRLVRRCRTAALILGLVGTVLLLVVALSPWNVVTALITAMAGIALAGCLLVVRRATLWSAVSRSMLSESSLDWPGSIGLGLAGPGSTAAGSVVSATVGPPRLLSPGVPSAPVKRRLGSSVVPLSAADGRSPGDGALIVHARADGLALTEAETVLVWPVRSGHSSPTTPAEVSVPPSGRGRFVVYRPADGEVFLATTHLTDTW